MNRGVAFFHTQRIHVSIFTYIYHKDQPNVGEYTIHGSLGIYVTHTKLPPSLANFLPLKIPMVWKMPISRGETVRFRECIFLGIGTWFSIYFYLQLKSGLPNVQK